MPLLSRTAAVLLPVVVPVVLCVGLGGPAVQAAEVAAHVEQAAPADVARAVPPAGAPGSRPSVLVIETDDMRADDLRFMPQTRRLVGQRGLTFTNSFAPTPLCCPSRASFLTGQYAHNHRVYTHQAPYGFASFVDRTTLATALRGVGYRTAMVGKYLNGYGYQTLRSHHGRAGASSLRYVPPGWSQWYGALDQGTQEEARVTRRGGTYQYFRLAQNVNGKVVTSKGYSTDVMGAQVRRLVDGFGASSTPWFLWWTPVAPHHGGPREPDDPKNVRGPNGNTLQMHTPARPRWVKGRFDTVITRGLGVRRDGTTEPDVSDKPSWMRRPELTPSERTAVRTISRQRAEALAVLDRQVGLTLERLYRSPQGRRTLVVFTSDNGYYLGEHRRAQGKGTLLEPALRVPLLVAGPGVPVGTRHDPVSNVDLAPTIAALAGARLPAVDGVDLAPTIRADRGWNRPVLTAAKMQMSGRSATPLTLRGVRLGRYAFTRYANGEVELYDMERDPLQMTNVAGRPEYASVRARLLALVAERETCRGAACSAPLPADLAMTPSQVAAVTVAQQRATSRYYG